MSQLSQAILPTGGLLEVAVDQRCDSETHEVWKVNIRWRDLWTSGRP